MPSLFIKECEVTMEIVIIGNGFDISLGLPTKYIDIQAYCLKQKRPSIWNYIYEELECWSDFEALLKDKVLQLYEAYKNNDNLDLNTICNLLFQDSYSENNNSIYYEKVLQILQNQLSKIFTKKDVFNVLFQEVQHFEQLTLNYFNKIVGPEIVSATPQKPNAYEMSGGEKIGKLKMNLNAKGYLINFNYTIPWAHAFDMDGVNIHGSMASSGNLDRCDLIFGFEVKEGEYPSYITQFFKSYRVKHFDITKCIKSFDEEVEAITIYGHSLGVSDEHYFIKLFELLNLYESNIILRIYGEFKNKHIIKAEQEQIESLLEKYKIGVTDKLLSESRLKFIDRDSIQLNIEHFIK